MKIIECLQYSPEWWELHRGLPTASNFDRILTAKTMKLSASADDYICELIGSIYQLGPICDSGKQSLAMKNGTETEPEARRWYEMECGLDVRQVGMCITDDDRFGCSPDGLVGTDGGLELKCPTPKTQVRYLLDQRLPDDYKAQVHGCLVITKRLWWDFASYAPGLPPFLLRISPDEYTEKLSKALEEFWTRFQELRAKIAA